MSLPQTPEPPADLAQRRQAHTEELARALAEGGLSLVQLVIQQYPQAAADGVATRIASGESPAVTMRWREDRVEVRVGLDGAGDSPPTTLLSLDFSYAAPAAPAAALEADAA